MYTLIIMLNSLLHKKKPSDCAFCQEKGREGVCWRLMSSNLCAHALCSIQVYLSSALYCSFLFAAALRIAVLACHHLGCNINYDNLSLLPVRWG